MRTWLMLAEEKTMHVGFDGFQIFPFYVFSIESGQLAKYHF
jgi:hypothetical protein